MKATNGNVFITVEKTVVEKIGILFQDVRFNRHAKIVICGDIIEAPEFGDSEPIGELFEGIPRRVHHRSKTIRASECELNLLKGDKAYFHYLTLEMDENFVMFQEKLQVYRVRASDIFCVVRDGKIIMNLNYVLAQPYWREGLEDLGDGIRGKTKEINGKKIVTEVAMKPDVNIATIHHIGDFEGARGISKDDVCLLTPNCEFENEIEGVKYWVFKQDDIIAVKRDNLVVPVKDWCLIQTDEIPYTGILTIQKEYLGMSHSGIVVAFGDKPYIPLKRGAKVIFAHQDMRKMMSNLVLIPSQNIQCYAEQERIQA